MAASDLEMLMLIALDAGDNNFVLRAAGKLDRFGDMLDQAYLKVVARFFQMATLLIGEDEPASALAELGRELEIERIRTESRELLPLARSQCEGDATRNAMLDQAQQMLNRRA